jgi:hypothetical protein
VDSSEIVHQGVGDDVSSAAEVIPNDQPQHLSTLWGLVKHPDVTVGSVRAVAVNHGDGEGSGVGFGHGLFVVVGILQQTEAVHRPQVDQFSKRPTLADDRQGGHVKM